MLPLSSIARSKLGVTRATDAHLRILNWIRIESGLPMWGGEGFEDGPGAAYTLVDEDLAREYSQAKLRQHDVRCIMACRWHEYNLHRREVWFAHVAWSARRYLRRRATPSESATLSRRLTWLVNRGLVERESSDAGGRFVRLTPHSVEVLHAIAAERGARLDASVTRVPRHLRELVFYLIRDPEPPIHEAGPASGWAPEERLKLEYERARAALTLAANELRERGEAVPDHIMETLRHLQRGAKWDLEELAISIERHDSRTRAVYGSADQSFLTAWMQARVQELLARVEEQETRS